MGVTTEENMLKCSVVQIKITFDVYMECLERDVETHVYENLIRSDKHNIYSTTRQKIAQKGHDYKRFPMPFSHETLPKGFH